MVDINQADPQSNAIHVAHNIPKDSDITVVQTNPFNTTVHISMNVGTGSKVCFFSRPNVLLSAAGEGDDDQRAQLTAARKLQRNGEQVGHSPFLAALVPIFLSENLALAHLFG